MVARASANSDRSAQLRAMLADRFKLTAHAEMRDRPVYLLMPARADRRLGPSVTPATIDCSGDGDPGARRREAGLNTCGLRTSTGRNGGSVSGGGLTMERIASTLANYGAERPVIDRTGINGFSTFS